MNIAELQVKQGNVNLEAEIVEKSPVREFNRFGKVGKVCTATIKDETGTIDLTLWNENVDAFAEGDKVRLTDGFVNEWQGRKQLTTGKNGKLEKIGAAEPAPEMQNAA